MSTSDVKSREAFPLPTVDKANLRYQAAVRELNNRAVAYRRKDDFSSAIQKYNDALVIDRKFAVLYNNRGVALLKSNAYDGAISDFNRALIIDPDFEKAYRTLSRLLKSKLQQPKT